MFVWFGSEIILPGLSKNRNTDIPMKNNNKRNQSVQGKESIAEGSSQSADGGNGKGC